MTTISLRGSVLVCIVAFCCLTSLCHNELRAAELKADTLFDSTHLLEVEIELPKEDWDELRKQSRGGGGMGGFAAIFSDTKAKPFTYFKGDVTVNGVKIGSVGIRKKGFFGSVDETRPSLKIKFSEYVEQAPIDGLDRLTLNNNKQDTALVSQFLTYKIFNAAGVHAPRVSFAKVSVNGKYLGIYSHVESVKKPFLKARYGDDSGSLYEGTLADFYPKAINSLESKTGTEPSENKDVVRLSELLAYDDDLPMDEINKLVDVDQFLKFWAIESLLGFWDGYTQNQNNYFVYENPKDGKFNFMPWGADSSFTQGGGPFARGGPQSVSVKANAMLPVRLFHSEGIADRYKETLLAILKDAWNEEELIAEIDRIEELTKGKLHARQKRGLFWGRGGLEMDDVRKFIRTRRKKIMKEMEDWPVEVEREPRKPMYTIQVGAASGSLATHWASKPKKDSSQTSLSKLKFQLEDEDVTLVESSVTAGPMQFGGFGPRGGGPAWTPPATIVISGERESDEKLVTVTLTLDATLLEEPTVEPIEVSGTLSVGRRAGFGFGPPGQMVKGQLNLSKSGIQDGDAIEGTFDLKFTEMHGGFMDRFRGGGGRDRGRGRSGRPD